MKNINKFIIGLLTCFLVFSCEDGIDPITKVDPGADASAPQIKVISPAEGAAIKVFEDVTELNVELEVTDDIEVEFVTVYLNNSEIKKFTEFKDYRIVLEEFTYENLVDGDHVLKVDAQDIEGKTSTLEVNFSKQPPYESLFDGEALYMPFDGDYRDLIGFQMAEEVGSPGFAGSSYAGTNAYQGAVDSYLEFPSEGLLSNEFSAAFWYKASGDPGRAGIMVAGDDADDRRQGFRLFREGSDTEQRIKLNVGTGTGESWNDGGVIDVTADEWVHVAFTISQTESKIYFNGIEMNTGNMAAPIDWTNVGPITIGSGGDTFSYWNHKYDNSGFDELRIFNKALSQVEIQIMINAFNPYVPLYPGETFYMPFDDTYVNLVGGTAATPVEGPSFSSESYEGLASYAGATDAYITHPASESMLTPEFSAAFWYNVNGDPDRAGILVISDDDDRQQGFRLFREGSLTEQRIKLNVGTGVGESWNDGGVIDATTGDWVHVAMTISSSESKIFFNGIEANSATLSAPVDWTGCDLFTIGSGGETFNYWNHNSDLSMIDELRFFNKALSTEEVVALVGGDFVEPYFGATVYAPFDGDYANKVTSSDGSEIGSPTFTDDAKTGSNAYLGAADSYVAFPVNYDGLTEFSGAFWYKVDPTADRAGILTLAPPRVNDADVRTAGFRLFREGNDTEQRIKLHVGAGGGDVWNDGDVIDVTAGEWVHIAFTVSETDTQIYFNGEAVANSGDMTGKAISWEGCTSLSIGSGAPNFIGWNHLSDNLSKIDELYMFDKILTPEEIQDIMNN